MRKEIALLLIILGLTFVSRLYRIDSPLADWHSWRQSDTASVTRDFVENGIDFLHPTYHDLSNVPSGKDNPNGYRFVEFPIYNGLHAVLYKFLPGFGFEVLGRLITVIGSVFSAFFIYAIVKRYAGVTPGLFAAFFYALLPFAVYFGRVILPDPLMTTSFLGSIYFFILWTDAVTGKKSHLVRVLFLLLSLILAAGSLLLKPFAVFFLLPLIVISYQSYGWKLFKRPELYLFALFTVLPLGLWRWWMLSFPEGIPTSDWLLNGGNIRFTGAYFYWIFAERIGKLILGYFGAGIFLLGLISLSKKTWLKPVKEGKSWIFISFLFSSLLYLVVVARGNVQHDYYQIPIIPSFVMVLGLGASFLWEPVKEYSKHMTRLVLLVVTMFTLSFSWYYVRDFFNINNRNIVTAGSAVDKLTPKDAKVIAIYDGDTSFLYQTKRKGWASFQNSLPEMIEKGAQYLVIVNPNDQDREGFGTEYSVVASTAEYLLVKLR